jgi:alanine dehydrogenase
MDIGVPRDRQPEERRIALTPAGVRQLVRAGHRVWVEEGAGAGCHFADADYLDAGATVAFDADEPFRRADLLVKVGGPVGDELQRLRPGQALMGFLHLAAAPTSTIRALLDRRVTAVGYEVIEEDDGHLPILTCMSEMAGALSVHIAAHLLESREGGRGVLLGGAPGIPPATLVILGAGTVGTAAARTALGCGAQVVLLDADVGRLRRALQQFPAHVTTLVADPPNVERAVAFADALIGAVLIHGRRTPVMVTREMVSRMKPGSVILDVSIDQGGCIETSRPTTLSSPTYVQEGVIHYCVPNMTAAVARTAAHVLNNVALPYVRAIADKGVDAALRSLPALARGVYLHGGYLTRPAADGSLPCLPLDEALSRSMLEGLRR